MQRWSVARAVLTGGLMAGAGDILFALCFAVLNGSTPQRLLQIVASGALGKAALDGGAATALVGLLCHFLLSLLWAALFVLAARRRPALAARPLRTAPLLGLLVFLVMRLLVLPLSAFPFPLHFNALAWGLDLLSHIFLFALPIARAASKVR